MSKRNERREAERIARKLAYQQLRAGTSQSAIAIQQTHTETEPEPSPTPNANFQFSTGPRTEEGKATSSRNATKHGCCSTATLILAHENIEDYKALESTWLNSYNPKEDAEKRLVQQLVEADWFLQRTTRAYADVEASLYAQTPNPADWTEEQERKLARHLRYRTAQSNLVVKARKAVEDYRKNRTAEVVKSEKHEIYKEKNKPEPTVEEMIAQLKKDKIEKDRQAAEQNR